MKKKGFTLIELLMVIGIVAITISIGTVSIRRQQESKAKLKLRSEMGDFFRVLAKNSKETGRRYKVYFKLDENLIEVERNGLIKKELKLPSLFEYQKITGSGGTEENFVRNITPNGNISLSTTIYAFKSNKNPGIQGDEKAEFSIMLKSNDSHVKYLRVREYSPKITITQSEVVSGANVSKKTKWSTIKD